MPCFPVYSAHSCSVGMTKPHQPTPCKIRQLYGLPNRPGVGHLLSLSMLYCTSPGSITSATQGRIGQQRNIFRHLLITRRYGNIIARGMYIIGLAWSSRGGNQILWSL